MRVALFAAVLVASAAAKAETVNHYVQRMEAEMAHLPPQLTCAGKAAMVGRITDLIVNQGVPVGAVIHDIQMTEFQGGLSVWEAHYLEGAATSVSRDPSMTPLAAARASEKDCPDR